MPRAAIGLFLGLLMVTVGALQLEGVLFPRLSQARAALLAGAGLWSLRLAWRVTGQYARGIRRLVAIALVRLSAGLLSVGWSLLFWLW